MGGGRRGKQRGIRHAVTGRRPREGRPGPGGGGGGGGEDQRRGGPAVQPPTTPALFIIGGGEPGPVAGEQTTKQEAFSGSSQSECAQEQARHRIRLWSSGFSSTITLRRLDQLSHHSHSEESSSGGKYG